MGNSFNNNKLFEKFLIFCYVGFLFICLGLLSFTSHAEDLEYFPMRQNENETIVDQVITYSESNFDSENNNILIYGPYATTSTSKLYYFFYFSKESGYAFAEINSNQYQISFYTLGQPTVYGGSMTYSSRTGNVSSSSLSNPLGYFQNLNSSKYDSSKSYVSNFRVYTSNNNDTRQVVLLYGQDEPTVNTGHAIPPDPFEDPTLATGSNYTLPREVPESPTINNYTWITYNPPSIDTTNVESLLESLIYVINYLAGWLRDNLAGEFQNFISNITGLINYIGETIQYYGGLIISNIQNGIETFYNNMVSLFEPVVAKIDYLTEPVDGTIIYDNISSTSLVSNINTINTSLTDFQDSFNDLSEPSSFTIPIHLENLPSAYFGNQTTQYIDLGVIGSTEKGLIRTFMWALITYGLFITIVDSISNYINGGGDES